MLAMAAVLATLTSIEADGMLANAIAVESRVRDGLRSSNTIKQIKGRGCLLGIEFNEKCAPVHSRLLEQKIITGTSSDPLVLRLLPPLNTKLEEIDLLIEALN